MKCPKCYREIGQPKKYEITECKCGAKLMLVEINKKKELVNLKEEN